MEDGTWSASPQTYLPCRANPTTVSNINPRNAQIGVPLHAQITAVMSDDIDPATVTNSSIKVTPSGGSALAGTVTLASDGVALTFVPSEPAIFIMGSADRNRSRQRP